MAAAGHHGLAVPKPVAIQADAAANHSVAARVCWHTYRICRALQRGVDELQAALAEVGEHADAILELAIDSSPAVDAPASDATRGRMGMEGAR